MITVSILICDVVYWNIMVVELVKLYFILFLVISWSFFVCLKEQFLDIYRFYQFKHECAKFELLITNIVKWWRISKNKNMSENILCNKNNNLHFCVPSISKLGPTDPDTRTILPQSSRMVTYTFSKSYIRMISINIDIQGESSLDFLIPATQKYVSWQPVPVRYRTRENKRFLSLLSLTRSDNERREVHDSWLSQWWLKFVLISNSYIIVCYFIYHDNSSIFTPVYKTEHV